MIEIKNKHASLSLDVKLQVVVKRWLLLPCAAGYATNKLICFENCLWWFEFFILLVVCRFYENKSVVIKKSDCFGEVAVVMLFSKDLNSTYLVWLASHLNKCSFFTVELWPALHANKVKTLFTVGNANNLVVTLAHKTEGVCCTTDLGVCWESCESKTLLQNICCYLL